MTIADIQNICNNKDVDVINQILLAKGWSYYDSKDENESGYGVVRWAYNKSSFGDKANGWFSVITSNGLSEQCEYTVFNKPAYFIVFNAIKANGYKFLKSSVEENSIVSRYANAKYYLSIHTLKLSDDEYVDNSLTGYKFLIEKKGGILDNANGSKKIYYEDSDTLQIIYNLKDGMFHGAVTWYHRNGKVMKTGNFVNDRQNGQFKEYDEEGNLVASYTMVDDSIDGIVMAYDNQKLVSKVSYKNGAKQGVCEYYSYNGTGALRILTQGIYKTGVQVGVWNTYLLREGKKILVDYSTYKDGIQIGKFRKFQNDSVIYGTYKNGYLEGEYLVYSNSLIRAFGIYEFPEDSSQMSLSAKGFFKRGKKTGLWRYYNGKYLVMDGHYVDGFKDGEWNYYYSDFPDCVVNPEITGERYKIENYSRGKLNGSVRLSSLSEVEEPCDSRLDFLDSIHDTCFRISISRFREQVSYKDNQLDGLYLYSDSVGNVLVRGYYQRGVKNGNWLEYEACYGYKNKKYYYYYEGLYENGLKQGAWLEYFNKDSILQIRNYYNGDYDGESISYYWSGALRGKCYFEIGKLKKVEVFNEEDGSLNRTYDILDETPTYYRLIKTDISKEYTVAIEFVYTKDSIIHESDIYNYLFYDGIGLRQRTDCYPDGKAILYDARMEKISEGTLFHDAKIGDWLFYYPDQDIELRVAYDKRGEVIHEEYFIRATNKPFTGSFKYLKLSTDIGEVRQVKRGLRNGVTIRYCLTSNHVFSIEEYSRGEYKGRLY